MHCLIRYTSGKPDRACSSIKEAVTILLNEYPNGVVYDAGGFEHTEYSADEAYDIREGRAALVWRSKEDAENDDSAKAVASVTVEEED